MTRKPSRDMTKILAIHSDWLRTNGYPLHVKKKKQNFTIQGTGAPQPTREIAKIKSTGAGASYLTRETCSKF